MKDSNAIYASSPQATIINRPVNRLGRSQIYDRKAERSMILPDDWRIYRSNGRAWIGGSVDGERYLHLERLPYANDPIPSIWAEQDVDLYICAVAPAVAIAPDITCLEVSGAFSGKEVYGSLAKVQVSESLAYLVLVIMDTDKTGDNHRTAVVNIAETILRK